jgi:ATP-binding cassette subfamily B protein
VIRAAHGDASVGDVVIAVTVGQRVGRQVIAMADSIGQVLASVKAAHRFLWLEEYSHAAIERLPDPVPVPAQIRDGLRFDDVSFSYPGTATPVLEHVSLDLPAGATIALVGENGAGKTTLVKLLTRMYEPTSGTIRIDGQDLGRVPAEEWRSRVTAAFQDFTRYELLARQTIGVGDLSRLDHDDAITTALDRARSADLVASLDEGLETRLGRSFVGGRELSGGQWQKLALARAMMRDEPLLLVFDEPTASLDASTEHALFERFAHAAERAANKVGAITLLVSHRFSTVRMADLIVVVDGGRIVEQGAHRELMEARGVYAELFSIQARAYT